MILVETLIIQHIWLFALSFQIITSKHLNGWQNRSVILIINDVSGWSVISAFIIAMFLAKWYYFHWFYHGFSMHEQVLKKQNVQGPFGLFTWHCRGPHNFNGLNKNRCFFNIYTRNHFYLQIMFRQRQYSLGTL